MNMTEIKPCRCENAYQDARYGKKNRVWNRGIKSQTCTVCGASVSAEPLKVKAEKK